MKKEIIIVSFLAIVCLGFSGCLPKSEQPQAPENNTVETTAEDESGKNDSNAIKEHLKNMFNDQDDLEYKITYIVKSSGAGLPEEMENFEIIYTHYKKGEKMRIDSTVGSIDSRTYLIGETIYICTKMSSSWSCLDHGSSTDDETEKMKRDFINEMDSYNVRSLGKRTIAKTSTDCYEMEKKDGSIKTETCVASEKIPLYIKMDIQDEDNKQETIITEMTATSFSTSVLNSDFDLPSEPTELNAADIGSMGGMNIDCGICNMLEGEAKENCLKMCE